MTKTYVDQTQYLGALSPRHVAGSEPMTGYRRCPKRQVVASCLYLRPEEIGALTTLPFAMPNYLWREDSTYQRFLDGFDILSR